MQVGKNMSYFVIKAECLNEIREAVIVEFLEMLPHCRHKTALLVASSKVGAWNTAVKKIACSILIWLELDAKDVVRSNIQSVLDAVQHQKIILPSYFLDSSICCKNDLT